MHPINSPHLKEKDMNTNAANDFEQLNAEESAASCALILGDFSKTSLTYELHSDGWPTNVRVTLRNDGTWFLHNA
jgi:hypothetical protein